MALFENYRREERARLEPGDYRVEIVDIEKTSSKSSGKEMLVISVSPNGFDIKIKHYIVEGEYFNRNLTEFRDSFGIAEDDFEFLGWVGAVGAAKLAEDENGYMKVRWFLTPDKAARLPAWSGAKPERATVNTLKEIEEDDEELPFI